MIFDVEREVLLQQYLNHPLLIIFPISMDRNGEFPNPTLKLK